eukprot:10489-Heterococcus_DN1.PRE.2
MQSSVRKRRMKSDPFRARRQFSEGNVFCQLKAKLKAKEDTVLELNAMTAAVSAFELFVLMAFDERGQQGWAAFNSAGLWMAFGQSAPSHTVYTTLACWCEQRYSVCCRARCWPTCTCACIAHSIYWSQHLLAGALLSTL